MECREIRECYSDYVEGASPGVCKIVEEHMAACAACREELRNFKVMLTMLKKMPELDVSPAFRVKVNEKLDAMENRGLLSELRQSLFGVGGWSKALATAATFVLIILGAFYFRLLSPYGAVSPNKDVPKMSDETARSGTEIAPTAQPSNVVARAEPSSPAVVLMRSSRAGDPIKTVKYVPDEGFSAPSAAESSPLSEETTFPTAGNQPVTAFTIPPPSRSKAAYPDHIVLIKAENHAGATEQVRNLVQSLNGQLLTYGSDVTFCQIPFEIQDQFLIALESLGKVTVVNGPIERTDAHYFLVEVITIPVNP